MTIPLEYTIKQAQAGLDRLASQKFLSWEAGAALAALEAIKGLQAHVAALEQRNNEVLIALEDVKTESERLTTLINTPELTDFTKGMQREAAHQRERWDTDHDDGKTAADWFWLLGYLAQKAMYAQLAGNINKALHHTITTAAACANWHAAIQGKTNMRPGIAPPHELFPKEVIDDQSHTA